MFIKSQEISHPLFLEKDIQLSIKRLDLIHPHISGNKFYKLKYNLFLSTLENILYTNYKLEVNASLKIRNDCTKRHIPD